VPAKGTDTPVLVLLFFILPVLGLFALMGRTMRFVFAGASALTLLLMWGLGSFLPRPRTVTSVLVAALALTALLAAIPFGAQGSNDPAYYAGSDLFSTQSPDVFATADPALVGINILTSAGASAESADGGQVLADAPVTAAKAVLQQYLDLWKTDGFDEMVSLTWQSWRNSIENPRTSLYIMYKTRPLLGYEIEPTTVSDRDTTAVFTVTCEIEVNSASQKQQYQANLYLVDGAWYVDPATLKTGVVIADPTPEPDPNATPTPAPTTTVSGSTTLYYNKDGGKYYHAIRNCPEVAERYWAQMSTFKYNKINDNPYAALKPCPVCDAPHR